MPMNHEKNPTIAAKQVRPPRSYLCILKDLSKDMDFRVIMREKKFAYNLLALKFRLKIAVMRLQY